MSPDWSQKTIDDMPFFKLFQYCLRLGLDTIGDFSSEQLLHDPLNWLQGKVMVRCPSFKLFFSRYLYLIPKHKSRCMIVL